MNNDEKKPLKEKLKDNLLKIKKIKNIEVIICIILIAIVFIIYGAVKKANNNKNDNKSLETIVVDKSDNDMLEAVLKTIKGAGNVEVFISYEGTKETVYVYDTQKNTVIREDNSGGQKITTTEITENTVPVFVKEDGVNKPLVSKILNPKITGVIVVAQGANDIGVRLQLLEATSTALKIDEKIIKIFIMN